MELLEVEHCNDAELRKLCALNSLTLNAIDDEQQLTIVGIPKCGNDNLAQCPHCHHFKTKLTRHKKTCEALTSKAIKCEKCHHTFDSHAKLKKHRTNLHSSTGKPPATFTADKKAIASIFKIRKSACERCFETLANEETTAAPDNTPQTADKFDDDAEDDGMEDDGDDNGDGLKSQPHPTIQIILQRIDISEYPRQ